MVSFISIEIGWSPITAPSNVFLTGADPIMFPFVFTPISIPINLSVGMYTLTPLFAK